MKALLPIAAAALLAACATAPVARDAAAPAPYSDRYAADRHCFTSGTRMRHDDPYCRSGHYSRYPGRAYTGDELLRTGGFTVGEALRRLDPGLR